MHRFGHNSIDRLPSDENGVASLAELLIVMAVSAILFISLLNGQEFVTRLSQKFFDTAIVESESRLLLERIEADLAGTDRVSRPADDRWSLIGWHGDTIDYLFVDSNLTRAGEHLVGRGVRLLGFDLTLDTAEISVGVPWRPDESDRRPSASQAISAIRISFTMSRKGKRIDIDTLCALRRRAPGT